MMEFAGYDMPVQYSSIINEHLAVRERVGVFDVSHMGEFFVTGPDAEASVQHLVSNDVTKLYDGKAMYSVMCHEDGGIVDDLLVYRLADDKFLLVVNAANIDKDWEWVNTRNTIGAEITNRSDEYALIAVQGPKSPDVIQALTDVDVSAIKFYHFTTPTAGDSLPADLIISRTGYTGETGFELYCKASDAVSVWKAVFAEGEEFGIQPVGLGARDTLRLEAGFCLYGNDITDDTNPYEAGLGWITKLDKGEFYGSTALGRIKEAGLDRRLVAFVMEERGIPRGGYPILDESGNQVGVVTSGTQSPILSQGIGLGYVQNREDLRTPGSKVFIEVRGRALSATVAKPPLHRPQS